MCIGSRRFWVRLFPKILGDLERVDIVILPPSDLVAGLMQLPVMTAPEGDGEFIANFHPESSGLGEPQVMRVGRLSCANQTRL